MMQLVLKWWNTRILVELNIQKIVRQSTRYSKVQILTCMHKHKLEKSKREIELWMDNCIK